MVQVGAHPELEAAGTSLLTMGAAGQHKVKKTKKPYKNPLDLLNAYFDVELHGEILRSQK